MNLLYLRPGEHLLKHGLYLSCLEPGLHLRPATLVNILLGFVEHSHLPDPLPLCRQVWILMLGPLAGVAAHRNHPATLGQGRQRCIEDSAAHGVKHHVDASAIRQLE